ncbi:hypothetical protein AUJ68_03470 [Candidatus Woesearchaeota archaeon CG1_02_57_44]|nr:MAG: hypothetical protein AUJ68_03470 [Candidatus Woesearchaeota archaeon CG1_02_57_44]
MARKDETLKKDIEALLFASGKRMHVDEIAKAARATDLEQVQRLLEELHNKYEQDDSSLYVLNEHPFWRLSIKDQHRKVADQVVSGTELSKSLIETLAMIAYKAPVLQSDIVRIRSTKAYDHIKELEELSYIRSSPKGRSKELHLADKFYEYFDVSKDQLKATMGSFAKIEQVIDRLGEGEANEETAVQETDQGEEPEEQSTSIPAPDQEIIEQTADEAADAPLTESVDKQPSDAEKKEQSLLKSDES